METSGAVAPDPIAQALACYDAERQSQQVRRDFQHMRLKRPKFKPLVLSVVPSARVCRVGSAYVCFIDGEPVNCHGDHNRPDKAWMCLARFIAAGGASR
jgi:hypothetical protein